MRIPSVVALTVAAMCAPGVPQAGRGSLCGANALPINDVAMLLLQVKLPPIAAESLTLLGKATPGVSLLCLGLIMSSEKLKMSGEVWTNLGLKLFIHPVLMFAATVETTSVLVTDTETALPPLISAAWMVRVPEVPTVLVPAPAWKPVVAPVSVS